MRSEDFLNKLSLENLTRIQKVLKIILDEVNLRGWNKDRNTEIKISIKRFENQGFSYEEVVSILQRIAKEAGISILNEEIKKRFKNINKATQIPTYEQILIEMMLGISSDDLRKYIILKIRDLNRLKEIENKLDERLKEKQRKLKEAKIFSPYFDKDKGILCIRDKKIKVRKFSNQYYMLELIFKTPEDLQKDWQYSEIQESIDTAESANWKRLYDVVYALNKKILEKTGIKNFFIITTQSVKINPKYLK
jgi:hypothetical protein